MECTREACTMKRMETDESPIPIRSGTGDPEGDMGVADAGDEQYADTTESITIIQMTGTIQLIDICDPDLA